MTWLTMFGLATITYLNRFAFFSEKVRYTPSENVRRFLGFSTYAILTSIWAPIIFSFDDNGGFSYAGNDYLIAASVAAILAFFRVQSIVVVLVSTALFFVFRFVV